MSKTVFTLPWNLLPGDTGLIAWVTEQGIDPARVVVDSFRIDEDEDGTRTLYYLEFDWNESGKRIIGRVNKGPNAGIAGYQKSIRSALVSGAPTLETKVAR